MQSTLSAGASWSESETTSAWLPLALVLLVRIRTRTNNDDDEHLARGSFLPIPSYSGGKLARSIRPRCTWASEAPRVSVHSLVSFTRNFVQSLESLVDSGSFKTSRRGVRADECRGEFLETGRQGDELDPVELEPQHLRTKWPSRAKGQHEQVPEGARLQQLSSSPSPSP